MEWKSRKELQKIKEARESNLKKRIKEAKKSLEKMGIV